MGAPAAVVTGAAKRIGRSIAVRLHQQGYSVVVHFNNSVQAAKSLVAEFNAARAGSAVLCQADLTCAAGITARCDGIIDCCFRAFGRCDVLVNNASAYDATPLLPESDTRDESAEAQIANIFGSNAIAPLLLIRAFARRQTAEPRHGRNLSVVNLSDAMIERPLPGFCIYTMAKHALHGLTKAAAAELAPCGIRVNAVAPGISVLPDAMPPAERDEWRRKVPLGQREASVEQVAEAVAFLVSGGAAYTTGTTLNVDGGLSLGRA
ncbi:putative NAD(P)-dependent oxidoreductase [Trypanosoma grayi]|uniref:putative NAD(P)-dependent oxidoreductase n=1 Tax=Trypanosoma grayi TaxID=71804 RepID=UPI0004F45DB3|nr:putative NAD(P)-dependent oxidoreductase [Trypanosoma grayi]KEG08489.1 putative NAD(P)-dependent oxidoreductase [Trypanosoma grayi]